MALANEKPGKTKKKKKKKKNTQAVRKATGESRQEG